LHPEDIATAGTHAQVGWKLHEGGQTE
jgi:hypothetical protein